MPVVSLVPLSSHSAAKTRLLTGAGFVKPVSEQTKEEWVADYEGTKPDDNIARLPAKRVTVGADLETHQKIDRFVTKKTAPKIIAPDDLPVFIPEGSYIAKCYNYSFGEYWGDSKLTLKFEIDQGRYAGTRLECFFNLDRKKNTDGEYVLAPKKRRLYVRIMRQMFSEILEAGGDWLSPDNLLGKSFRVEVVTVAKNHERASLGCNQYSKIKPNIELLHG